MKKTTRDVLPLIVADSSGLVSLINPTDSNHVRARMLVATLRSAKTPVYIPFAVFAETLNVVGKKLSHQHALQLARLLCHTEPFLIVESAGAIRDLALTHFEHQPASVSYIDCLVMATADHLQTKTVLGFDEAFRKNGYALPEPAAAGRQSA